MYVVRSWSKQCLSMHEPDLLFFCSTWYIVMARLAAPFACDPGYGADKREQSFTSYRYVCLKKKYFLV